MSKPRQSKRKVQLGNVSAYEHGRETLGLFILIASFFSFAGAAAAAVAVDLSRFASSLVVSLSLLSLVLLLLLLLLFLLLFLLPSSSFLLFFFLLPPLVFVLNLVEVVSNGRVDRAPAWVVFGTTGPRHAVANLAVGALAHGDLVQVHGEECSSVKVKRLALAGCRGVARPSAALAARRTTRRNRLIIKRKK